MASDRVKRPIISLECSYSVHQGCHVASCQCNCHNEALITEAIA